jgi:DsbC/DsbD-like thiol-disulfide interchange protein
MYASTIFLIASTCMVSAAAVKSGKAEADWLSASPTCEPGKPVQTALRLVVDEHWHTYWSNPGEGGMKLAVKWELPTGWTAGELEHPVPKRFMTGELPGFGYEGTVIFPIQLTPPAGFSGTAQLKGKFSWLTCNDDQCLPGNAALELTFTAGPPAPSADATAIEQALKKIPQAHQDLKLSVVDGGKSLTLTLEGPIDVSSYDIFPLSPQVIDSAATFSFQKNGTNWTAEVPKSEYASGPISDLSLVLAGKSGQPPLRVEWKMN